MGQKIVIPNFGQYPRCGTRYWYRYDNCINVLEHASIVCSGTSIEIYHLPAQIILNNNDYLKTKNKPYAVKEIVASVEKELILSALATYKNNRTKAMQALGFSRRVFYDKLHRYGIQ